MKEGGVPASNAENRLELNSDDIASSRRMFDSDTVAEKPVPTRYSATVIVRTDSGVGLRAEVAQEVVHISLAIDGDEAAGIKYSQNPTAPWAYHSSRDGALRMAQELMDSGRLAACGVSGCALQLVIPGIPFPLGSDFQGDQEQDAGIHMSIYNRPGNAKEGVAYQPPDLEGALALAGNRVQFGVEESVKILNGSEANDLKTGLCYYVSISCDQRATDKANEIQRLVGLPVDSTQRFHLSIAGIAPSWLACHPKSAYARSADQELKKQLAQDYRTLRRGDAALDFAGFNDDTNTGWTTYADTCAQWARENTTKQAEIKALPQDEEHAAKKVQLESQLRDIKSLGFCKPVGPDEKIKRIATPPLAAQERVVENRKARSVCGGPPPRVCQ